MQPLPLDSVEPPLALRSRAAAWRWPDRGSAGVGRDAQFVELLNGYRHSGGLARSVDVGALLRQRGSADVATMARWIVGRQVVSFEWQAETWLPLFQLGELDMQPHAAVGLTIVELGAVMPPWQLAQWFARPNSALAGRRPADVLAADAPAVVQAARGDRWLLDA